MKNFSIAMLALALILVAGNLYACGNQSKADVSSAKADIHRASSGQTCPVTGSACEAHGNVSELRSAGAKVISTEYRRSSEEKDSDIKACPMSGSCCVPGIKTSAASMKAETKDSKNNGNFMVIMEVVDLASFYQK
jgi:hypothetical protein